MKIKERQDCSNTTDQLKQKGSRLKVSIHSPLVSFTALLLCPSAALESIKFHPGAGSLGAQAALWLNTGFSIYLRSNSNHSLSDTNTVINLFKPQVAGLLSTKWG